MPVRGLAPCRLEGLPLFKEGIGTIGGVFGAAGESHDRRLRPLVGGGGRARPERTAGESKSEIGLPIRDRFTSGLHRGGEAFE